MIRQPPRSTLFPTQTIYRSWRARHRMLARPAAIKLIRPSLNAKAPGGASTEALRRFEREAQVTARLRSPHTVELFDFGVAEDRKSTRLNSSHLVISYAVFCL